VKTENLCYLFTSLILVIEGNMGKTLTFLLLLVSIPLFLNLNTSSFATNPLNHLETQSESHVFAQSGFRSCESHCRFAYRSCL